MIGSTANIVALGMLEKRYRVHIYFFQWFKVGAIVGLITCLIAWGGIALLSPYMPTKAERIQTAASHMQSSTSESANNQSIDTENFPLETIENTK
jgi:di/tricarboxylate transporter